MSAARTVAQAKLKGCKPQFCYQVTTNTGF